MFDWCLTVLPKVRIMRVLNSIGYIREIDEEKYAPTPITKAMTAPPLEAAVKHKYGIEPGPVQAHH